MGQLSESTSRIHQDLILGSHTGSKLFWGDNIHEFHGFLTENHTRMNRPILMWSLMSIVRLLKHVKTVSSSDWLQDNFVERQETLKQIRDDLENTHKVETKSLGHRNSAITTVTYRHNQSEHWSILSSFVVSSCFICSVPNGAKACISSPLEIQKITTCSGPRAD